MNYSEAIQFLYNQLPVFHRIGAAAYKPGLENTIRLMDCFENPHQKFRSIHVAGTNGKGSVSHMLASVFQKAGYRTGLYTSPHLIDFSERIRIDGKPIDEDYVVDFVQRSNAISEEIKPSFFELTMAMAFTYFAEKQVDIAIIETGLGGRLDSTNIIVPELSVITNIGLDHTEFLGDTLEKIAFEKAGIIKDKIPVVIGEYVDETKNVFLSKAKETESSISFASESIEITNIYQTIEGLHFTFNNQNYISQLSGLYQIKNTKTVLEAFEIINKLKTFKIGINHIQEGLRNVCSITNFRGRWEKISENPKIYVDTAHNIHGIKEILKQIDQLEYQKLRIVFGMVKDKDIEGVLSILPYDALYYFANADSFRSLPSNSLKESAAYFNLNGNAYPCVNEAIKMAVYDSSAQDLIIIFGSNYVVGEALSYLDNNII